MASIYPNYNVPSRTTFSERYVPRIYTDIREKIKLMLRDVSFLSLSTDGWTGCNGVTVTKVLEKPYIPCFGHLLLFWLSCWTWSIFKKHLALNQI